MTYENYKTWVSSRILSNSVVCESGCIEYGKHGLKHKYGLVSITTDGKRKSVPAHRALYMAANDCFDLPSNVYIRHKCDNPRCVNIAHLIAGTPKDNTQDCLDRGRRAKKYRLHTRKRILDNETIIAIRNAKGKQSCIAHEFGISIGYVSKIRSRQAKTLI